jgi:hypothetical protein
VAVQWRPNTISNGFNTQQGTGQRPFPTTTEFFTASAKGGQM